MGSGRGIGKGGRITVPLMATSAATIAALLPLASSGGNAGAAATREPASQLLKAACSATLAAPAFRAQGHIVTNKNLTSVDVYFGSAGELVTLTQHGNQNFRAIVNGPSTYIKGNGPFWRAAGSAKTATVLANHWINMTSDKQASQSFTKDESKTSILQDCGSGGSSTYKGTATVNGTPTTKIHQNSPNESNIYYVEDGPTPYILRIAGNATAKETGNLVFSDYGVQPNTTAPAGAIPISQFG